MKNGILSISLAVALILTMGLVGCGGEGVPEITQHNLTISSTEGGTVTTPGEGTFTYNEGEKVNLAAIPKEGYQFVSWIGDVGEIADVDDATTTIAMNGNYTVTANFKEIPPVKYGLTTNNTTGGSVTSPGLGTFTYDEGTIVNLVATPTSGYQFIKWTGDIGTIADVNAANTTITMDGDYFINANFEEEEEVHFPDANLEAAIREAIEKPTEPIYRSDLEGLTHLMAYQRGIGDLTGLEYCTNLIQPWLWGNQISDISPLASLTKVMVLSVGGNEITDISPLANLTSLRELWIDSNLVSDISALSGLTELTELYLWVNQISDISPLANLTNLTALDLGDNRVSDIYPLVQNDGLGEGDVVWLWGNPLSAASRNTYIPELKARGVTVNY